MPSLDRTLRSLISVGLLGALALGCGSEPQKGPAEASSQGAGEPSNNGPEDGAVEEAEPNNGLKQAQALELKKTIRGTLGPVLKGKGDEDWFAIDTGLPIRNQRRIEVDTDTPIGSSTYTEEGEFRLASLTPTR